VRLTVSAVEAPKVAYLGE